MRVRADNRARPHLSLVHDASRTDQHTVTNFGVVDHAIRADPRFFSNARLAEQLDERLDYRVRSHRHVRINDAGLRAINGHTLYHQLDALTTPQLGIYIAQVNPGVAAQHFVRILGFDGDYFLLCLGEDGGHICEVVLTVGIVGTEQADMLEERLYSKRVEPGIDFLERFLLRLKGFFLDDCLNLLASLLINYAAVAIRTVQYRCQNSHRGALLQMLITQFFDGCCGNQRRIAGKYDYMVVPGKRAL